MFAAFVPYLWGALATAMASLVWRAVFALGFGFISYKGIDTAIGALKNQVITSMQGIGGDAASLAGYLWIDKALSVVFSAVVVALSMRALTGTVKRLVAK